MPIPRKTASALQLRGPRSLAANCTGSLGSDGEGVDFEAKSRKLNRLARRNLTRGRNTNENSTDCMLNQSALFQTCRTPVQLFQPLDCSSPSVACKHDTCIQRTSLKQVCSTCCPPRALHTAYLAETSSSYLKLRVITMEPKVKTFITCVWQRRN